MSIPSTHKPLPLSITSPRASPFRRPASPASPSTTIRPSTPTHAATKPQTPSKLHVASTPPPNVPFDGAWTPSSQNLLSIAASAPPPSPSKTYSHELINVLQTESPAFLNINPSVLDARRPKHPISGASKIQDNNAHARLPAAQVRELREAFQVLDRDSDGLVGREDVEDMLTNLGLDASSSPISWYFPASSTQKLSLPTYLSQLSSIVVELSPPSELLAAFAAFDADDSGQIDVDELREALLYTGSEAGELALTESQFEGVVNGFVGRKGFGKLGDTERSKSNRRGGMFRYMDFIGELGCVGDGP